MVDSEEVSDADPETLDPTLGMVQVRDRDALRAHGFRWRLDCFCL
jgi:hypothetical protein